jgi:hypothetical protein
MSVTGLRPASESAALATVPADLVSDPALLARMGARAAELAADCHVPKRYAELAVTRLL